MVVLYGNYQPLLLNKLICKVWNLPYNSHIYQHVHCVARTSSISNIVYNRFLSMYSRALSNCSSLVRLIFIHASQLVYTFSGYNHVYGLYSPCEVIIRSLSCD